MNKLDELERLSKAATPGLWTEGLLSAVLHPHSSKDDIKRHYIYQSKDTNISFCEMHYGCEKDAELIAAMRNNIDALIKVARTARDVINLGHDGRRGWDEYVRLRRAIVKLEEQANETGAIT